MCSGLAGRDDCAGLHTQLNREVFSREPVRFGFSDALNHECGDDYLLASERVEEDTMDDDGGLTVPVEEAGALLGIFRAFAYELAARGELPCVRLGRRLLVRHKALDELLVVDHRERST